MATISQSDYNKILAEAQKKGRDQSQLDSLMKAGGISIGNTTGGKVSSGGQTAMMDYAKQNLSSISSPTASLSNNTATNPTKATTPTVNNPYQSSLSSIQPSFAFGDTGGSVNTKKNLGVGVQTGSGAGWNKELKLDTLKSANLLFGNKAVDYEGKKSGYLETRNDALASGFLNSGITDEAGIRNYLSQFLDFSSYDKDGQANTVTSIYNRIGALQQENQTSSDPLEGLDHVKELAKGDYRSTVNSVLKNSYGIDNIEKFKAMYGDEAYYMLYNSLKGVEGVWDATDPDSRNMLEGNLQEILAGGVGTGVDQSKLNLNKSAILSKFTDQDRTRIENDLLTLQQLQGKGMSVDQIASEMGVSQDQVNQMLLMNQGLPSKIGDYYKLNDQAYNDVADPYETRKQRLEEDFERAMAIQDRDLRRLQEDYEKNYSRQKKQNEVNLHNLDMLMGMSGTGYSRRGLEGWSLVQDQAKQILDDMFTNYDRTKIKINDIKLQLATDYARENEDITKALNEALKQAKNNYIANTSAIQQQYGLVGLQGQQAIAGAVSGFINQAETIYNNAFERSRTLTNDLINNYGKLEAIEQQQIQTRQMKIQQFQQESMYMTADNIFDFAQEHGITDIDQLLGYQQQATIATLDSYIPGVGAKYSNDIAKMLSQGYTPQQVVNAVMNSSEVQAMGGGGEFIRLNDNTIFNKSTGQFVNAPGAEGGISGQGQAQNTVVDGLINFADGLKIGDQGGQCGSFVNDYLQSIGLDRAFTDPIDAKKATVNSTTPAVGSIAVFDGDGYNSKYGHVAIVTGVNPDGTINTLESNKAGEEQVFARESVSLDKVVGFYDPSLDMKSDFIEGNIPGVPLSYQVSVWNKIPQGLKNAEGERKDAYDLISKMYHGGIEEEDASLVYMGFNVKDPKLQNLASNLVTIARTLPDELSPGYIKVISDLINKKEPEKAIRKAENTVLNHAKKMETDYISEGAVKTTVQQVNNVQEFIDQLDSNPVGVVSGTMQKWLKKLKGKNAQKIATDITQLVSKMRNEMIGSQMTDKEMKMLEPLIPDLSDSPKNFMIKLNNLKNTPLLKLNNIRTTYGLPALDEKTLFNYNTRIDLYNNSDSFQTPVGGRLTGGGGTLGGTIDNTIGGGRVTR